MVTEDTDLEVERTLDFFYEDYTSLRVSFRIVIINLDSDSSEDLSELLNEISSECIIEEVSFSKQVMTIDYEIGSGALLE